MNNYLIYARKSSESEDRQMLSLDSQLNELNKLKEKLNLNILKTIQESKSAKNPNNRIGFNEMIKLIEEKKVNCILAWHPNRLSRNPNDSAKIVDLMDRGLLIQVLTPSQTFNNVPMDKFMLTFLMAQAKLENDNKGVDVKRGMKTKAEMGWYPYPAMNGYLNTPERPKGYKIIIKDPDRFHLISKMWDLMLTGIYVIPQV